MRYRELKEGMLITGKPKNGYAITNDKSVCKVLVLQGLGNGIYVEVVFSPDDKHIGSKWPVDYKRFVKYVDPLDFIVIHNDKEDDTRDFQVGDYVIGNEINHYAITKRGVICKIVQIHKKEKMIVRRVQMNPYKEEIQVFNVKKKCFNLYRKKFVGLFAGQNLNGTIKVVDNKPILSVPINTESPCYKQIVKELVDNGLIKKEK